MDKVKNLKILESFFKWSFFCWEKFRKLKAGVIRRWQNTNVQSTIEQFKTVKISNQIWMLENLNVSRFRNGDEIPEVKTEEEWKKAGEQGKAAWCYYNNDPEYGKKFGKLYNCYALMDPRGLVFAGWSVPSNEEWDKLTDHLGGNNEAGIKMKNTSGWNENGNGNNLSGFKALPGGQRSGNGSFDGIGNAGYWWSSTEKGSDWTYGVWYRSMSKSNSVVHRDYENEQNGFSVRCICLQQDRVLDHSDFHT
jgi:uncharacterized protein (TIGR02145 family)